MSNAFVLLNSILDQQKDTYEEEISDDILFELFSFDQVLKDYDITVEDISLGRTGGGNDGGVDGIFTFIDGELLHEDTDLESIKKHPNISLYLIQAKGEQKFGEVPFDRVSGTVCDAFDLGKDFSELTDSYNQGLIEKMELFRSTYISIAKLHPILKVHFMYVSKGDTATIERTVRNRADILKGNILKFFPGSEVYIDFYGARELVDLNSKESDSLGCSYWKTSARFR